MKKLLKFLSDNIECIYVIPCVVLFVFLFCNVIEMERNKKEAVSKLTENGYSVEQTYSIAGSNVYQFSKNGKTYIVGEKSISEYTK